MSLEAGLAYFSPLVFLVEGGAGTLASSLESALREASHHSGWMCGRAPLLDSVICMSH